MTDPNYTHLVLIVDRSGSMNAIRSDAEGGVKALVEDQRQLPGKLTIDLWQFDHAVERVGVYESDWRLIPGGSTSLLDALGQAITTTGTELAALPEDQRPGKVIVQVTTDGYENSSREWKVEGIRKLITQQRESYAWEFVYAGASPDAFHESSALGFTRGQTITYVADGAGTRSAYAAVSAVIGQARQGDAQ